MRNSRQQTLSPALLLTEALSLPRSTCTRERRLLLPGAFRPAAIPTRKDRRFTPRMSLLRNRSLQKAKVPVTMAGLRQMADQILHRQHLRTDL